MRKNVDIKRHGPSWTTAAALALLCAMGMPATAQSYDEQLPEALEDLDVVDLTDARLPLDLQFVDDDGNPVRLGDLFDDGRPVLMSLVYYRCPMLCNLVLDGMVKALSEVDLAPGADYRIVTVSIDPTEKPQLARQKKQGYVEAWGSAQAYAGWHALTGPTASSRTLADAVGFTYRYLPDRNEYAHPAVLFIITPDGRLSRYLHGVKHEPRTVELALVEASEGKIGSALDQFVLYCYQYDAQEGRYAPVAMRIMRIAAGGAALVFVLFLLGFWRREVRQKRLA